MAPMSWLGKLKVAWTVARDLYAAWKERKQ